MLLHNFRLPPYQIKSCVDGFEEISRPTQNEFRIADLVLSEGESTQTITSMIEIRRSKKRGNKRQHFSIDLLLARLIS